eukprot:661791-Amphidinium_carterae.2
MNQQHQYLGFNKAPASKSSQGPPRTTLFCWASCMLKPDTTDIGATANTTTTDSNDLSQLRYGLQQSQLKMAHST